MSFMNHPYMCPEDAPWTPEAIERELIREQRIQHQIDMELAQEEWNYNHSYSPRRPGR